MADCSKLREAATRKARKASCVCRLAEVVGEVRRRYTSETLGNEKGELIVNPLRCFKIPLKLEVFKVRMLAARVMVGQRLQSWLIPQSPHRLRNDLKCVEWDVKPCSIQSNPIQSNPIQSNPQVVIINATVMINTEIGDEDGVTDAVNETALGSFRILTEHQWQERCGQ